MKNYVSFENAKVLISRIKSLINAHTSNTSNPHKVTPTQIGAAPTSHGTHVTYGTNMPKANGAANVGSSNTVSRSDHVHPLQTAVSGNSGSTTKLATARKIGNASFDGTANITLSQIGAAPVSQVEQLQETVNHISASHAIDGGDLSDNGPVDNTYDGGSL